MGLTTAERAALAAHEGRWLKRLCKEYLEEWKAAIQAEMEENPPADGNSHEHRKSIQRRLAENAAREVAELGAELDRMLLRTSVIVAATTLLFAVYAFKASVALGVLLAAVAFITALIPMCPPILRAWKDSYVPRHVWTLLATNDFKQWVIDCWLADRRTVIVTRYKRAHSIAVPVLGLAAAITAMILTRAYFK